MMTNRINNFIAFVLFVSQYVVCGRPWRMSDDGRTRDFFNVNIVQQQQLFVFFDDNVDPTQHNDDGDLPLFY